MGGASAPTLRPHHPSPYAVDHSSGTPVFRRTTGNQELIAYLIVQCARRVIQPQGQGDRYYLQMPVTLSAFAPLSVDSVKRLS
jgi:hypothetical protein